MTLIDLTAPIAQGSPEMPANQRIDIAYEDHAAGARVIAELFGVGPELLRDGEGWANETFTNLGLHVATHVDAPWHYNSTIGGERARTIDELPLEWFHAPGVRLDFTAKEDGDAVTRADVEAELERIGHALSPLDIVLVHTGRDAFYGAPDYIARGPGVTAEATLWMHDAGVRVMGIDAWGWDRPLHLQAADAVRTGQPGVFWEAHQVDRDYSQIERLVNLGALPATGFTVSCFPLPVVGASGAPARVVAHVD